MIVGDTQSMAKPDLHMPVERYPGAVPTLNGRGFMLENLDPYSQSFVSFASEAELPLLDIGCAYGVATLAALPLAHASVLAIWMQRILKFSKTGCRLNTNPC